MSAAMLLTSRQHFFQRFQSTLSFRAFEIGAEAGQVLGSAHDRNRITDRRHHHRNALGRGLCRKSGRCAARDDDIDIEVRKLACECRVCVGVSIRRAIFEGEILSLDKPSLAQRLDESLKIIVALARAGIEHADAIAPRDLRTCCKWPRHRTSEA